MSLLNVTLLRFLLNLSPKMNLGIWNKTALVHVVVLLEDGEQPGALLSRLPQRYRKLLHLERKRYNIAHIVTETMF